jgi:importin-5
LKDSQDDDNLSKILVSLIDLAETSVGMFKPMFSDVVRFSIGIVQDKELSNTCRQNALELLATFADNSPNLCKNEPTYATEMVTQCLSLMTDIGLDDEDASEWNDADDVCCNACKALVRNILTGICRLRPMRAT